MDIDKKSNYEILGLPEDASDSVVKRKYGALLRQYKQRTDEHGITDDDAAYCEAITKAYDEIMGITHDYSAYNPSSVVPYWLQKAWAKFAAFFDQYNILIICIVLVFVGGVIFTLQYFANGKEDLAIRFVGAYNTANASDLMKQVDKKSESVDNSQITFFSVTTNTPVGDVTSQNNATNFKGQLMSGGLDVVLMDKESFDVYVRENAFMKLNDFIDEYYKEYGNDIFIESYSYESKDGDKYPVEDGVYGIDVTESNFFDGTNLMWLHDEEAGQEKVMILAICRTSKRVEKAESFAVELINGIDAS